MAEFSNYWTKRTKVLYPATLPPALFIGGCSFVILAEADKGGRGTSKAHTEDLGISTFESEIDHRPAKSTHEGRRRDVRYRLSVGKEGFSDEGEGLCIYGK